MENASKALLIAGAILLVIALIAIAMMILNRGREVVEGTGENIDALAVQAFNSKFNSYLGENKSASEVRDLISLVIASRVSFTEDTTVETPTVSDTIPIVSNGSRYDVSAHYATDGRIDFIDVD